MAAEISDTWSPTSVGNALAQGHRRRVCRALESATTHPRSPRPVPSRSAPQTNRKGPERARKFTRSAVACAITTDAVGVTAAGPTAPVVSCRAISATESTRARWWAAESQNEAACSDPRGHTQPATPLGQHRQPTRIFMAAVAAARQVSAAFELSAVLHSRHNVSAPGASAEKTAALGSSGRAARHPALRRRVDVVGPPAQTIRVDGFDTVQVPHA